MEAIIEEVMKAGDKTKEALYKADKILAADNDDAGDLEESVMKLDLDRHQRMVVNDYVACIQTAWNRTADLAYVAGIKDTLALLASLDLIAK